MFIKDIKYRRDICAVCLVVTDSCNVIDCSPWHSPGKNTEVSCHSLLQSLLHCRQTLYRLSYEGSPHRRDIEYWKLFQRYPTERTEMSYFNFWKKLDKEIRKLESRNLELIHLRNGQNREWGNGVAFPSDVKIMRETGFYFDPPEGCSVPRVKWKWLKEWVPKELKADNEPCIYIPSFFFFIRSAPWGIVGANL